MFAERNHAVFKTQQVQKHRQGTIRTTKPLPKQKPPNAKLIEPPPELVMQAVRRVTQDISRSLNPAAISYAHANGWINDWERNFYTDIGGKRSLSERQRLKRAQINRNVLKHINGKRN
jgi:ABC-type dipeptide/oligopeptide/nickel transport system ATPase subunit